jgi:hypothetical protein
MDQKLEFSMSEKKYTFFVMAALIAAELNQATKIARRLSLTASNARAVALRAGERAAGFRPLTDYIDRLANVTVNSSLTINKIAANLSKTSADKFRTDNAVLRFEQVYKKANNYQHIDSLSLGFKRTKQIQKALMANYKRQLRQLSMELDMLEDELRTAVILATLSRVEASQAGALYEEALKNVADNVESAASLIKSHIRDSQKLVFSLRQE